MSPLRFRYLANFGQMTMLLCPNLMGPSPEVGPIDFLRYYYLS